jgi:hypothetical protein
VQGGTLSFNFRSFLSWLGISDAGIRELVLAALKLSQNQMLSGEQLPLPEFRMRDFPEVELPAGSISYQQLATWIRMDPAYAVDPGFSDQIDYVWKRRIDLQRYDFYWNKTPLLSRRVIIPFYWKNRCVGYQTRSIDPGTARYYTQVDPGYVYNLDKQQPTWNQVLVCEGVFDAMSVDGCATLGSTVTEYQANQIDALNKPVIVVPDRDKSGADLIESAMKYHWSVSFPIWFETCKDINAALVKYGKLFTIKAILDAVETSSLRIEIMKRRWY